MRIRRRLATSSIATAGLSDLQLRRSEAALPPDQLSNPPKRPSDQNRRWVFPEDDGTEEKMKEKEFEDDEACGLEGKKCINDDMGRVVSICDGEEGSNKVILLSSPSSAHQESWREGGYKVVPLKKRKGSFERNPNQERMDSKMKSKTNKKCGLDIMQIDQKPVIEGNVIDISSTGDAATKKSKIRGNVIMEGSRCSRVNGRGWRCCQPTLVGYSLCEHHLGKGRMRSMASVRRCSGATPLSSSGQGSDESTQPLMVTKRRTKVGVVKARSMSSLLSQT